jgi:DNA-binding NtrC family response regulator
VKPRAVVVDDDETCLSVMRLTTERQGFDTVPASRPEEAFVACVEHRPELVIADVMLPLESGVDLAVRILQVVPDARFVFVCGTPFPYWADEICNALRKIPAESYRLLDKPFLPESLAEVMRSLEGVRARIPLALHA